MIVLSGMFLPIFDKTLELNRIGKGRPDGNRCCRADFVFADHAGRINF